MRPSVWFIVPANGRHAMARVCLRQLARTCAILQARGLDAHAVVIADDANLDTADELGFGTIERGNAPLGRKWNDGYELAGREGVDFMVPFGTDDWIDPDLFNELPGPDTIRCSRRFAMVREDGQRIAPLHITYDYGHGVRIIPSELLAKVGFRPAEDDRLRAIDTSVIFELTRAHGRRPHLSYLDLHPFQMVDWKSPTDQLNSYESCQKYRDGDELADPLERLADFYPAAALTEIAAVYTKGAR